MTGHKETEMDNAALKAELEAKARVLGKTLEQHALDELAAFKANAGGVAREMFIGGFIVGMLLGMLAGAVLL